MQLGKRWLHWYVNEVKQRNVAKSFGYEMYGDFD
jgi:hypothetical protein